MGIKFSYQYEEAAPKVTIKVDKDATTSELLDAFNAFMLAAGYEKASVDNSILDLADYIRS